MLYAHRRYLVKATQLEKDTELLSRYGRYSGLKGDWLLENERGDQWIVPFGQFENQYESVELESAREKVKVDFTENEIAEAYAEGLPSNVESDDFIRSFMRVTEL